MEQPLPTIPPGPPPPPPGWSSIPPSPARSSSLTVASLAGTTFRVWGRNVLFLSLLGAVASLPMAAVSYRVYLVTGLNLDPAQAAQDPLVDPVVIAYGRSFLLGLLGTLLVWSAVAAAAIHATAQALRGERVRVGPALSAAFHRGPYVVLVVLLASAAILATACTVVVPALLAVGFCAALPSTVLEGTGPVQALLRSWELTRGHRWTILGGLVVVAAAVVLSVLGLESTGVGVALAAWGPGALEPGRRLAAAMAAYGVIAGMLEVAPIVACAVAHHRLRAAKAG